MRYGVRGLDRFCQRKMQRITKNIGGWLYLYISDFLSDIVIPYAWNKEFVDQEIFFLKIFMIVD